MTLREEILKSAGLLEDADSVEKYKLIDIFNTLFEKAMEEDGREYSDFVGSEEYKKWVNNKIKPILKNDGMKKIFEKWERDLFFDID